MKRGRRETENGPGQRPEFGGRVLARCDPRPRLPRFLHFFSWRRSYPLDVICNDHTVKVCRNTLASCSGGPLLPPKARAALHEDRSRCPFQVSFVHFRLMSISRKTTLSKLPRPHGVNPFQRPVEGQPLPPPRPTPGRPMPRSLLRSPADFNQSRDNR